MTFVQGDAAALAIIESWGWDHADPRFEVYVPLMLSLSEVVNRLAMEGHADPAGTVLSLLASGKLEATGSHWFKAYRNGRFQREGVGPIPVARWKALKAGCDLGDPMFGRHEVRLQMINGWVAKRKRSAPSGNGPGITSLRRKWLIATVSTVGISKKPTARLT